MKYQKLRTVGLKFPNGPLFHCQKSQFPRTVFVNLTELKIFMKNPLQNGQNCTIILLYCFSAKKPWLYAADGENGETEFGYHDTENRV